METYIRAKHIRVDCGRLATRQLRILCEQHTFGWKYLLTYRIVCVCVCVCTTNTLIYNHEYREVGPVKDFCILRAHESFARVVIIPVSECTKHKNQTSNLQPASVWGFENAAFMSFFSYSHIFYCNM